MRKNRLISKDLLNEIANDVGSRYGYSDVNAEFAPFTDFKIKWRRTYKTADVSVSDYLQDSPEYVVENVLDRIFSAMAGREPQPMTEDTVNWMTSQEFIDRNQPKYLRRFRHKEQDDRLEQSYQRLIERGYVSNDPNKRFYWSERNGYQAGVGSKLMDTVFINPVLKDQDDEILDYAVMKGVAATEYQFGVEPDERDEQIQRIIDVYPEAHENQERLESMGLFNRKGRFLGWLKR